MLFALILFGILLSLLGFVVIIIIVFGMYGYSCALACFFVMGGFGGAVANAVRTHIKRERERERDKNEFHTFYKRK